MYFINTLYIFILMPCYFLKDATLEKKTSITSKATSKDLDDDSMVISSPVPLVMRVSEEHTELEKTSSVNLTNSTSEVARSTTVLNTENEDESIRLEQAAIKAQAAFRGYLVIFFGFCIL